MKLGRRVGRAVGVVALAAALSAGAGSALATTGATPLAHPPKYQISKRQALPFTGLFKLSSGSPELIDAAIVARFNEAGFFEGTMEVYYYRHGEKSSWVGTTYEYHQVGDKMHLDVFSPNGQGTPILARMVLVPRGNRLVGQLRMLHPQGPPARVAFTRQKR